VTLAADGATYLVVPQFAVGDVAYQFETFTLGRLGAPSASAAAAMSARARLDAAPVATRRANHAQAAFDLALRARGRRLAAQGPRPSASAIRPALASRAADTLGHIRSFHVLANASGTAFKTSVAALDFVGAHIYVYVDTAAPKNGFSASQLQAFGKLADSVLYGLDASTFGPPTDIDGNAHVIMLLTPIVNGLTPASECATQGFIAGFFEPDDLGNTGSPNSNRGEIFYQIVPDPTGTASCAHSVTQVDQITPGTFLHELQHMISFGQHVLVHGGQSEEGWLDEGESIVATELGSRYYEARYPPPTGRTKVTQMFPDSAEPFITEQLFDSYTYLTDPDTASLTLHSDADCCLAWRAGDWLLLRYVGDQFDSTVFARLDESALTGTANLAQATGLPFPTLFGNFGLALYADSIPGVARAAIPPQYRFVSRNLRALYQDIFTMCSMQGGCSGINAPFPITVQTLDPAGGSVPGSMVPGTQAFYQITTPSGVPTVTVVFKPRSGGSFPSNIHPQVSVFRTQ
jgi:hypothetical protein